MSKSLKIRLALVLILGSYIAWQEYQRQSVTMISTRSVLENKQQLSDSAELWSAEGPEGER